MFAQGRNQNLCKLYRSEPNKPVKKPKRVDASKDNEDKGPKVVVFDGSVLDKKPTIEDAKAKKAFMVSVK